MPIYYCKFQAAQVRKYSYMLLNLCSLICLGLDFLKKEMRLRHSRHCYDIVHPSNYIRIPTVVKIEYR